MPSNTYQHGSRCSNCQLRRSRLFSNLSAPALEHFDRIGQHATRPEKSVIFREGAPSDGIHLVCAGEVKLSTMSTNGRTMVLKIAGPGDILGLGAKLNSQPCETTALTRRTTRLKQIGRNAFLKFIRTHAEAAVNAASILATEHLEIFLGTRRLALLPSASARMAHLLMGPSHQAGETTPVFTMPLTHEEIAGIVGTSRETVTRLLNQFERDGLISRQGPAITVLRSSGLSELVQ